MLSVGLPGSLYLLPVRRALEQSKEVTLVSEFPSQLALKFRERSGGFRNALLSPLDYARHAGEYSILPGFCVASSNPTSSILLFVKERARNIRTMAVDIRCTSEIVLGKIILRERFPNADKSRDLQFIPTMPDVTAMLAKADCALVWNDQLQFSSEQNAFALDLVEEWNDLTGLPYVHGFFAGYADEDQLPAARLLLQARSKAEALIPTLALPPAAEILSTPFLEAFSYDFGESEQDSLSEFFRYAYYHGVLGDVPDLNFAEAIGGPLGSGRQSIN